MADRWDIVDDGTARAMIVQRTCVGGWDEGTEKIVVSRWIDRQDRGDIGWAVETVFAEDERTECQAEDDGWWHRMPDVPAWVVACAQRMQGDIDSLRDDAARRKGEEES